MSAEPNPEVQSTILACAIANDIEKFDLLIEDMEATYNDGWAGLETELAAELLDTDQAAEVELIAIALDQSDEANLQSVANIIALAKKKDIKVILVADNLGGMALHQLMRMGADDFVPYPLPEGSFQEAVEKAMIPPPTIQLVQTEVPAQPVAVSVPTKNGSIFPVYGMSGGVGSSTIAVNLAWELADACAKTDKTVCLIDFDLQFGSVSTFLEVGGAEKSFEIFSGANEIDADAFRAATTRYGASNLDVLPAPSDLLPLDFMGRDEAIRIVENAAAAYDFVVVDMPKTLVDWSDAMLERSQLFIGVMGLDMRSAQNSIRFTRALQAEDLPVEKVQYLLNRAPGMTDLNGKSRIKKMEESLKMTVRWQLPDGGKYVSQACDHGSPLGEYAAKNPMRKQIRKIATTFIELAAAEDNNKK